MMCTNCDNLLFPAYLEGGSRYVRCERCGSEFKGEPGEPMRPMPREVSSMRCLCGGRLSGIGPATGPVSYHCSKCEQDYSGATPEAGVVHTTARTPQLTTMGGVTRETMGFPPIEEWQYRKIESPPFMVPEEDWPMVRKMLADRQLEDYCGLDPILTGKHDPFWKRGACQKHDEAYQSLIDGKPGEPAMMTFGRFTKDIVGGMAEGAYMLLTGPIYWLAGGLGGLFRQGQLERRHKAKKPWVTPGDKNDGLGE